MPLFQKPNVPGKPEIVIRKPEVRVKPPEPVKKPEAPKDDWLHGRSEVSKYEMEKSFKNPKARFELKKELGLPLRDENKLNKEIDNIKKMIPNRFGGFITQAEAKRAIYEQDLVIRRESKTSYKTPDWKKEKKGRDIKKKERDFLKKKFGIK